MKERIAGEERGGEGRVSANLNTESENSGVAKCEGQQEEEEKGQVAQ